MKTSTNSHARNAQFSVRWSPEHGGCLRWASADGRSNEHFTDEGLFSREEAAKETLEQYKREGFNVLSSSAREEAGRALFEMGERHRAAHPPKLPEVRAIDEVIWSGEPTTMGIFLIWHWKGGTRWAVPVRRAMGYALDGTSRVIYWVGNGGDYTMAAAIGVAPGQVIGWSEFSAEAAAHLLKLSVETV